MNKMVTTFTRVPDQGSIISGEQLEPLYRWRFSKTENVAFEKCAFDCSIFKKYFGSVVFLNCRFMECCFDGIKGYRAQFLDCEFRNCKIGQKYASYFDRCTFRRTNFIQCEMHEVRFLNSDLSDALIDGNLKYVTFERCSMRQSKLTGKLDTGFLHYNTYENMDTSETTIENVSLLGGSLGGLQLPDHPEGFFISGAILMQALELKDVGLQPERLAEWKEWIRLSIDGGPGDFMERSLLEDYSKGEQDLIMKHLYKLSHAGKTSGDLSHPNE